MRFSSAIAAPSAALFWLVLALAWPCSAHANGGWFDPTFGSNGRVVTSVADRVAARPEGIALQLDGKIILVGSTMLGVSAEESSKFTIMRYLPGGALDATFGAGGIAELPVAGSAEAVVVAPDGKIYVAGEAAGQSEQACVLLKLLPNGQPDTEFAVKGVFRFSTGYKAFCNAVARQTDGKIVLAGYDNSGTFGSPEGFVIRLLPSSGAFDTSFNGKGYTNVSHLRIYAMALMPSGTIAVAGDSSYSAAVVRLLADGRPDSGFRGFFDFSDSSWVYDVAAQGDGKLVAAGGGSKGIKVWRFHTDGSLDTTFGADGIATFVVSVPDEFARDVLRQSDGKYLVSVNTVRGRDLKFAVARLSDEGNLDQTFGNGGTMVFDVIDTKSEYLTGMILSPDDKIFLSGFTSVGFRPAFALVRLVGEEVIGPVIEFYNPGGHLKFPHLWPGQIPPIDNDRNKWIVTWNRWNWQGGWRPL